MLEKPAAVLIGDALALDFLNTSAVLQEGGVDLLESGEGVLSWMTQVKLLEPKVADDLLESSTTEELDRVAAEARELREWFRGFALARKGRNLTADDALASSRLNLLLEADDMFSMLVPSHEASEHPIQLQSVRRDRSTRNLLLLLAEVMAKFLCDEAFVNVKGCEGPGCHLLFADHTRGRARRWCSMSMCGNRAKQAAHRSRKKGSADEPGQRP